MSEVGSLATYDTKSFLSRAIPGFLRDESVTLPVVRLTGMIGAGMPLARGLTLASCASALERAFQMKKAPAVIVQVNSPGGSPVQSRLIFERIRQLAAENSKKVFVFAEDVAASGGYMIALAGDEIYADAASIIGSIGVVSSGFGFVDLINKIGVQRRVYTSGDNKSQLDPFRPENSEDIERLKTLQAIIHEDFIALVKERRGVKLSTNAQGLFTGEFWTGRQALDLGLVDGIMDMRSKMRALYGDKVRFKLVSQERGWFRKRLSVEGGSLGAHVSVGFASTLGAELLSIVEERLTWARFGL